MPHGGGCDVRRMTVPTAAALDDAQRLDALVQAMERRFSGDDIEPLRRARSIFEEARAAPEDAAPRRRAIEAAELLAELQLDPPAVAAALLLDPLVDAAVAQRGRDAIAADVSREVLTLCDGVRRLQGIRWDHLEDEAAESLRKMFLAMASDVRVVLIALVERVQDMRGLDDQRDEARQRMARETMEIYAPLANRLGIWQLKWELEDLAFRQIDPALYREIKRLLAEKRVARTEAIDSVLGGLRRMLEDAGIEGEVSGRPKHIYSIYKKMQRKGVSFEQIYDVSAVRIIVEEVADCYAALGLVHGTWTPISGEFDDYIAKPKENFYRSLHTAVVGPDGRPLEIQIRTREMHEFNEFGVAAHWRYKEAKRADRRFDDKIDWLRQLMQWQKDVTDPRDLAEELKSDVFGDQVFVFTPTGDVIDLPRGSTPLDFAYRVHTQVGHRCRGAKVQGQIVPLDTPLRTGDRVEILTSKTGRPSRDWLNPAMVRTQSARQKIRQWFRAQERDQAIAQGRDAVERELERLGLDGKKVDDVALLYPRYEHLDDFLAAVGFGDISGQSVASRVLELETPSKPVLPSQAPAPTRPREARGVSMAGVDDVLSQPARCCNPVPGDEVVGFITRGRGLMIHRADCPNVRSHPEPDRLMPLHWGASSTTTYPVAIRVLAHDRPGLLRDIADLVSAEGVNMSKSAAGGADRDGIAVFDATLQIRQNDQLVRILNKLERLPDVLSARRVTG
jgi:RelA/SpoT family (p)ppGpp synthetase